MINLTITTDEKQEIFEELYESLDNAEIPYDVLEQLSIDSQDMLLKNEKIVKAIKLYNLVNEYMTEHNIVEPSVVSENPDVIEYSIGFIQSMFDIIGYDSDNE